MTAIASSASAHAPSRRQSVILILAGCVLFRLAVAGAMIGQPVLWNDEVFSLYYAQKGIAAHWGADWWREPTPPLYYSTLYLWTLLTGGSEIAGRAMSLAFSAATIPVVYAIGASLDGRRTGLVATLIYTALPGPLEYALEIRTYAFANFCWALAFLGAAQALRTVQYGRTPRALPGLLVPATVAVAYTHATALITLAALGICLALILFRLRPGDAAIRAYCARAALIVGVAAAPQVLATYQVMRTNAGTLAWLPALTPYTFALTTRQALLGQYTHGVGVPMQVAACLYVGAFVMVGSGLWAFASARRANVLLGLSAALPVVGILLFTAASLMQPILLPRTVQWTLLPLSILVASQVARLDRGAWRSRVLLLFAAATLAAVGTWNLQRRDVKRPWQPAVADLAARAKPGDVFASLDTESHCLVDVYARAAIAPERRLFVDLGPNLRHGSIQTVDLACNRGVRVDAAGLEQIMDEGHGVWILAWTEPGGKAVDVVTSALTQKGRLTDRLAYDDQGLSLRFERFGASDRDR